MITYGYIVNQKGKHNDDTAMEFLLMFPLATSKNKAWKNFIKTVGKDRQYWNKLNYIAEKIKIEVTFENK